MITRSIPVLDSVSVTLWSSLVLAGGDTTAFAERGSVFALPAPKREPHA